MWACVCHSSQSCRLTMTVQPELKKNVTKSVPLLPEICFNSGTCLGQALSTDGVTTRARAPSLYLTGATDSIVTGKQSNYLAHAF